VIARATPGFSGAEEEALVNEAALLAARDGSKKVCMRHFIKARDVSLMGAEKRSQVLTEEDKLLVALHESGHAIVAISIPGNDPVEKISCMPRGNTGGVMIQIPKADRHHVKKSFLVARLAILMGGRAAEEIFFNGDISAGAQDDIDKATKTATAMVCYLGMSEKIGPITIRDEPSGKYLNVGDPGRYTCSPELAFIADTEIQSLLHGALNRAMTIIRSNRAAVERISGELAIRTELSGEEIQLLLDGKDLPPKVANVTASDED
jgi:cell division protease FtsH